MDSRGLRKRLAALRERRARIDAEIEQLEARLDAQERAGQKGAEVLEVEPARGGGSYVLQKVRCGQAHLPLRQGRQRGECGRSYVTRLHGHKSNGAHKTNGLAWETGKHSAPAAKERDEAEQLRTDGLEDLVE